jgi:modification methylase
MGSYHNIFRIGAAMQDIGFWLQGDIIWSMTNPMPNFAGKRFTNAHETLIWAARSQTCRPTFNYHSMKVLNDNVQMRSDWSLPICTGPERLNVGGVKAHPTQKPEALLYRVQLATTNPGDCVIDPFFGTGTTGAVARQLGRRWIGIERKPRYAAIAYARIAATLPLRYHSLDISQGRRAEVRVPFGALVEAGVVAPGKRLFGPKKRCEARVRADGSIVIGDQVGSIHKLGAAALGAPSCNGWTFWHVEEASALVALDTKRDAYRAMLVARPSISVRSARCRVFRPRRRGLLPATGQARLARAGCGFAAATRRGYRVRRCRLSRPPKARPSTAGHGACASQGVPTAFRRRGL